MYSHINILLVYKIKTGDTDTRLENNFYMRVRETNLGILIILILCNVAQMLDFCCCDLKINKLQYVVSFFHNLFT